MRKDLVNFSHNQESNIEIFKFLIARNAIKDSDTVSHFLRAAIALKQWQLALLLLTVSETISPEDIEYVKAYKDKIISEENLRAKTAYGQYLLSKSDVSAVGDNCLATDLKPANNLLSLALVKTGLLQPVILRRGRLVGSLGRIYAENYRRDKKDDERNNYVAPLAAKTRQILHRIVKAAEIDNMAASHIAQERVKELHKSLEGWFSQTNLGKYNPLFLIFEVMSILVDKGCDLKARKKHEYDSNNFTKLHLHSSKAEGACGCYKYKFGLHLAKFSLSTLVHEFIHHLCQLINNTPHNTDFKDELHALALEIKGLGKDRLRGSSFDYFEDYSANHYSGELLPRLFEFYLQTGDFPDQKMFPPAIVDRINQVVGRFLQDVVRFRQELLEKNQNKPSRIELFERWKAGEYKEFFAQVNLRTYRPYGLFPNFSKKPEELKIVVAHGFPLDAHNKFQQTPLRLALQERQFDLAVSLIKISIDEKLNPPYCPEINTPDSKGKTLLLHCIQTRQDHFLIKYLIETCGANVSQADNDGDAALDYATRNGWCRKEIITLLQKSAAALSPLIITF